MFIYEFKQVEQDLQKYLDEQEVCSYNVTLIQRGFSALSAMDSKFLLSADFFHFLTELLPMMKGRSIAWKKILYIYFALYRIVKALLKILVFLY